MRGVDHQLQQALAEFYDSPWPGDVYRDYVQANDLDLRTIHNLAGATSVLPVVDCGSGRFDWRARGETFPAFVVEALGADGETTIDLVAWPLDRPHHVLTMFGRASLLGLWQALNPASFFMGKALAMHRMPLDWLKAGCSGAAVVVPGLAARVFLDIPGPIAARDRLHARELSRIARRIIEEVQIGVSAGDRSRAA